MKIQAVNNNQQQNKTNFNGKLVLPENMSELGKQFIDKCGERITKILEPEPYDMFLHEIPVNKNDKKIVLAYKEEANPKVPVKIILNDIITEFNRRMELNNLKLEFNKLMDFPKDIELQAKTKPKQKPYIPLKIGKPQKPFIKRKKYY